MRRPGQMTIRTPLSADELLADGRRVMRGVSFVERCFDSAMPGRSSSTAESLDQHLEQRTQPGKPSKVTVIAKPHIAARRG